MRFFVLLIVLGFPVLDLLMTVRFAHWTGVPAPVLLIASAIAGVAILCNERIEFRARTLAALHGDRSLLRGLLDSGRKVMAGVLFVLPGVLSDVIAIALLLLPINMGGSLEPVTITRGGLRRASLDGDYRRID